MSLTWGTLQAAKAVDEAKRPNKTFAPLCGEKVDPACNRERSPTNIAPETDEGSEMIYPPHSPSARGTVIDKSETASGTFSPQSGAKVFLGRSPFFYTVCEHSASGVSVHLIRLSSSPCGRGRNPPSPAGDGKAVPIRPIHRFRGPPFP